MEWYRSLKYENANEKDLKRAYGGNPWAPLEMKGVTSSRHPSAEVRV